MKNEYTLFLPWPPSENHYRRAVRTTTAATNVKSSKARAYPALCKKAIVCQNVKPILEEPIQIQIVAHAPDKKKRDLDNLLKAVLDALTANGLYTDDSWVSSVRVMWDDGEVMPQTPWQTNFITSNKGFLEVWLAKGFIIPPCYRKEAARCRIQTEDLKP